MYHPIWAELFTMFLILPAGSLSSSYLVSIFWTTLHLVLSRRCRLNKNCENVQLNMTELYVRYDETHENDDITLLLSDMVFQIHEEVQCLGVLFDESNKKTFRDEFFSKLKKMSFFTIQVKESEDMLSPNYFTLKSLQQAHHQGCNAFIILLANGNQAARLIRFVDRHRLINSSAKFIMLYDQRLFHQELYYIWKKFINIVFIEKSRYPGTYKIRSVPFPIQFQSVVPLQVNSWRRGKFLSNKDLFPDKVSQLRGQPLKVVTFEHIPSALKTSDNPQQTNGILFTGIEIEIVQSLAEATNFHPIIYDTGAEQWGERQTNGSYTGLLGELVSGRADIALGNLYHMPYYLNLVELTIPYTTECLTFLTPESRTDNSWKTLLLPFKINMWLALLLTLFLGGFLFHSLAVYHRNLERKNFSLFSTKRKIYLNRLRRNVINVWTKSRCKSSEILFEAKDNEEYSIEGEAKGEGLYLFEELQNSILYTYGMLTLVSLPKIPSGWALRIMTGWWWLYCLLVVVSYRASMTASLANPPPKVTIDTLQELAASHVQCGGWSAMDKQFFTMSLDREAQRVGMKFSISKEINSAVIKVAQGSFAYYDNIYFLQNERIKFILEANKNNSIGISQDQNLHIMSECIIKMPISIGLEKNSPLKVKFDSLLQRLIEAGLVKKWLDNVMLPTLSAEAKYTTEQIKALMNLKKLYGGLVVIFVGYAISSLVLILEKLYWKYIVINHPLFDRYSISKFYNK